MRRAGFGKLVLLGWAGVWGLLVLSSCTTGPGYPAYESAPAPVMRSESGRSADLRSPEAATARKSVDEALSARDRPGLATGWGASRRSELGYTGFQRAGKAPYGGVATIYYNDRDGIEAMTSWKRSSSGMEKAAGGLVEWGVKSGYSTLRNYRGSGRRFVLGREGKRYSLVVRNLARCRVEAVLSVDGLDVMDGKPAGTGKRGYIIDPGETLEVEGWRTSNHAVASFEFSSVGDSYANLRHGDTRNVGVIGLAVFPEKGVDPWKWMPREVEQRETARPFAEPPLRRAR